jgi:putative DNA primase/helicase
MSTPTQTLAGVLTNIKQIEDGFMARCPAHQDDTASLHVSEASDGKALLCCHAGCDTSSILAALNLPTSALFPPKVAAPNQQRQMVAWYDYRDESGAVLYQAVRFEPKDFLQRRFFADTKTWTWKLGDVRRVLYRLPELHGQRVVYVVEGEKDADALARLGLASTTNTGGAGKGKWKPEYVRQLHDAGVTHVVMLPDNDEPGIAHGQLVGKSCRDAGMKVKVVMLPGLAAKGDVSDWLAMGHTKEELVACVKASSCYDGEVTVPPAAEPAAAVSSTSSFAATCWHLTELGAAEFFADRHGRAVRFDHRRQRWLVWGGHRWIPDANAQVRRMMSEHLRQWQRDAMDISERERRQRIVEFALRLERKGGVANVLGMAESVLPIATDGASWDENLYTLGVTNGVVDLRTGECRAGHPEDMITMATACAYDAFATAPTWQAFLDAILPDPDVRHFMQVFVGYSLTGNTDEQVLAMLYGKGSNGKSTLLSVLVAILGDYASTIAFSSLEMKRSDIPSDIAGLQHVRFVMASEVKEGQRFNEARIKALTGGDVVSARHLYGAWFSFKPSAKFFLAVNHKPAVGDDSYGFWRRIRLVPFLESFTGSARVADMADRLLAERDGILQWAIAGCLLWQQTGLGTADAIDRASYEYQAESDPLAEFIDECCEQEAGAECKAGTAYSAYVKWAETRRMPKDAILRPASFGMRFGDKYERVKRNFGALYLGVKIMSERMF